MLDLTRANAEPWREDLVVEFRGHHFHMQQRALRTPNFYLVANPESIPELYDLRVAPYQLNNVYERPMYEAARRRIIGIERQHRQKSSGSRTHILIRMVAEFCDRSSTPRPVRSPTKPKTPSTNAQEARWSAFTRKTFPNLYGWGYSERQGEPFPPPGD